MKPWAFKVRGGGNATGTKGGPIKAGIQGGVGALWYEDKVFTVATHQDQWILAPITQPITNPMNEPAQPAPVGKPLRYLSVCSGMEAASVAWHPLGWTPVGFSEIEPFPCAILKHRFPNTPNYGSLTEYQSWPLEPGSIDLLVGGCPCQSFSVAGLRRGMEDPRGNLTLVFLGLADKLKPRWIVFENVPGLLSSNGGKDFGSFLGALVELGYGFAYRVLDAQHFGVPQRRRRVFVVACLGDWRAPAEVLFESDCVRRDIKKGRAKGQGVAASVESGVGADGMQTTVGTLCADTHPGAYSGQDAYSGRLIPCPDHDSVGTLCARDYKGVGNQYVQEGKCIPCSEQPLPITQSDIAGPLDAHYYKGPGSRQGGEREYVAHPIPYRKSKRACSVTDNETWVLADSSNTLNNFDLGDTRTTHAVVEPIGFAMREDATNGTFDVKQVDTSLCLQALRPAVTSHHAQNIIVHHQMPGSVAPTVTSSGPPYSRTGNERVEAEALVITVQPQVPMAVRRLTPVETERLQGFPDNWSRISWKGKPEDQCPDGPRYKACGNSMAVPVMRWIGERIANYELSQNHETK